MEPEALERRLHPSSLFFQLIGHTKGLLIPVILVLAVASGDRTELWLGLLIVPSMLLESWRYLSYRYRFEPDSLVIREGFVFRTQRHIPFARIQSIDLSRGPLQRLLGVAEVRIETAGGNEPEAHMRVVSLEHVEEMRRRIFRDRSSATASVDQPRGLELKESVAQAEEPTTLLRLGARDLLFLGLDLGRGVGLIFLMLGVAWEFGLFERVDLEQQVEDLSSGSDWMTIAAGLGLAAAGLLLLVFILSLSWTVVRLHGFVLRRSGDDFRLSCGLLTRLEATIPRHRIQLVSVSQSWLQRRLRRAAVVVEVAGGGQAEGRDVAPSRRWFAPLVRQTELARILGQIDPALELDGVLWRPLSARGRRRKMKAALIRSLIPTAAFYIFGLKYGLIASAILPLGLVLHARGEGRFIAHARTSWGIVFRSGLFTRKWSSTWPARVQVLALTQTPFDRRHKMASLAVDTAGAGPAGHRIVVPYLAREEAAELQGELSRAAEFALRPHVARAGRG